MSHNGISEPGPGNAGESAASPPETPELLDAHSRRRHGLALRIVGSLVVMLLAATYGTYLWHFHGPASKDPAAWGQFGDFVGGTLNSLVGLLTVLGLAWTVTLQMRQLDLSRQALLDAQHEMHAAATERKEAARTLKDQTDALLVQARMAVETLEQARLTAKAQAEAADHQLMATIAMQEQADEAKRSARTQSLHAALQATYSELAELQRLANAKAALRAEADDDQLTRVKARKAALVKALHDAADELL